MAYSRGSTGKKDTRDKYESVTELIKNALAQGDMALTTAGKAPQSGLLDNYAMRNPSAFPMARKAHPMASPVSPTSPGAVSGTGNADRDWIIQHESEGNPNAQNPNSSAFGLGQLIRSNREAYAKRFGFSPDTVNPEEQLQMMDAYVKERYGSYAAARQFWEQNNWY